MTTVERPPADTRQVPFERFLLRGVTWREYEALRDKPENYHVRMTYDRGDLEMMSPSASHEKLAYTIGRLIDAWSEELNIDILSCRTVTCRRKDLDRGFEPDNCYYVQHEPLVRAKKELDLTVDPPPDLTIEIELRPGGIEKIPIYAAFGVPEVWRYDGKTLQAYGLDPSGAYAARDSSLSFPRFPMAEAQRVLGQIGTMSETALVRSFRDWVRKNVASRNPTNP